MLDTNGHVAKQVLNSNSGSAVPAIKEVMRWCWDEPGDWPTMMKYHGIGRIMSLVMGCDCQDGYSCQR